MRPRTRSPTTKTTVEIENHSVLKDFCSSEGIFFRDIINEAIKEHIMMEEDEYFNMRYFKDMARTRSD